MSDEPHVIRPAYEADGSVYDEPPAPIDWPARFRAAANVARAYGWGMLPNALDRLARDGTPAEVEAIGRALLGDTGETVQAERLVESRRRSGLQWGPGRGLTS